MLAKRIIPCLDCDFGVLGGRVVKGIEFKQIRYAGIPWELAAEYDEQGADELVFLDITASHERRETMAHVIEKTASNVFMPLTVGGGIHSLEDARRIFNAGADKVSVNTAAFKNPKLVNELARRFGSQACMVAIDAKRRYNAHEHGPRWNKRRIRPGINIGDLRPGEYSNYSLGWLWSAVTHKGRIQVHGCFCGTRRFYLSL